MRTLLAAVLGLFLLAAPAARAEESAPALASPAKVETRVGDKEREEGQALARPSDFENRIRPVSGHLFLKDHRFEASPELGVSLSDAFFQKYVGGLKLAYHFSETVSFGVHALGALNQPSGVVTVCRNASCHGPTLDELKNVPGNVGFLFGVEGAWAPIYGKLNLVAEKVLHFDLGATVGVGAIQYQKPGAQSAVTATGYLGLGQRYFVSRSMTLRLELRDYIYSAETIKLGDSNHKIENQFMFELGFSFFLGEPPQT